MKPKTKTAHRFTFQGRGMDKPAPRYLSSRRLVEAVRFQFARMGCAVSPISRVSIKRNRVYDDDKYPGIVGLRRG